MLPFPRYGLRRLWCLAAVATVLTGTFSGTAGASTGAEITPPANFTPFAADSIWNLPLRADAPVAASNAGYISYLRQSVQAHGAWINTGTCAMPEYWAAPGTPTVAVTLNHPGYEDPALIQAWSAVPMPADAQPAHCSDNNFAVLQRQPDGSIKEWEFWEASDIGGVWSAAWGGAIANVETDRGVASPLEWTDPTALTWQARQSNNAWNVTASGFSMIGGVITGADLQSGQIDHALAMALYQTAAGKWMWPAQRGDGASSDPNAIPEGAHLRLNPSLNIPALHLSPLMTMIAEAAQRYGIVIRDQTDSADSFMTDGTAQSQSEVSALLDGQSLSTALAAFPWQDLEVLNEPICTNYAGCSATNAAVISVPAHARVGQPLTLDTTDSTLNFPRTDVRWDLTGTGIDSIDAGSAVTETFTPTTPGLHTVGVQITTQDGTVTSASATFMVAPALSAASRSARTARRSDRHGPRLSSDRRGVGVRRRQMHARRHGTRGRHGRSRTRRRRA